MLCSELLHLFFVTVVQKLVWGPVFFLCFLLKKLPTYEQQFSSIDSLRKRPGFREGVQVDEVMCFGSKTGIQGLSSWLSAWTRLKHLLKQERTGLGSCLGTHVCPFPAVPRVAKYLILCGLGLEKVISDLLWMGDTPDRVQGKQNQVQRKTGMWLARVGIRVCGFIRI